MPTVRDVALGLASVCTTVPATGDDVCERCHGCPGPGWSTCWSCNDTERQLSQPCSLVVPISLYEIPSQLHHILRHYKSGYYPDAAPTFTMHVAALLGHFLAEHGDCIAAAAGGEWDVITSVPSSGSAHRRASPRASDPHGAAPARLVSAAPQARQRRGRPQRRQRRGLRRDDAAGG